MNLEVIMLFGFEFCRVTNTLFLKRFQGENFFAVRIDKVSNLVATEEISGCKFRCFIHVAVNGSLMFDARWRRDLLLLTSRKNLSSDLDPI